MLRLHVNIDHVATLRNARGTSYPDPVFAAQLCEQAGADGITAHLREDRRHIRDEDVQRLRRSITTWFNLELAATDEMLAVARRIRPDVITLVPERREERTTEGGLDVVKGAPHLEPFVQLCRAEDIKLSVFVAPELEQVEASAALGAAQVELHTGTYCESSGRPRLAELERLRQAASRAHALGLEVAAGHGLNRHNVAPIAALPRIEELNIGHALIADAVFVGLPQTLLDYRAAIARGLDQRQ